MSVRLYAVARAGAVAPACAGAEGEPLRIVTAAGLAALVGTAPAAGTETVTEEALWRHEQAVEALMSLGRIGRASAPISGHDVLPARFGTILAGDGEVRALLQRRRDEFAESLSRVAGAVELAVRAALAAEPGAPRRIAAASGGAGTAYLEAIRAREELGRELAARIARSLGPLARDSRIAEAWGPSGTLASAHLVGRERLGEFRQRAERLALETDFAELVCTGPWPPYSFVGMGEEG